MASAAIIAGPASGTGSHVDSGMVLNVVVMAAGKGTRMHSAAAEGAAPAWRAPAYCSMFSIPLPALGADRIVVVTGHGADEVEAAARARRACAFVRQEPQLGTGHARAAGGAAAATTTASTLILNGDVPLIEAATLRALVAAARRQRLALLTIELADPRGYGRIVRDGGADAARSHRRDRRAQGRERPSSARSARSTPA